MTRGWIAAAAVCAIALGGLVLPGPALAEEYNDIGSDHWRVVSIWQDSAGGSTDYPWEGDTAIIDSHQVTCRWDESTPTTLSVLVTDSGVWYIEGTTQRAAITLGAGGTLWLNKGEGSSIASDAADKVSVTGDAYVKATREDGYWGNYNAKGFQDGPSSTGTLTIIGGQAVSVGGTNNTFTGGWNVQDGILRLWADGAAGTGTIVVGGGSRLDAYNTQNDVASKPAIIIFEDGADFYNYGKQLGAGWKIICKGNNILDVSTQNLTGPDGYIDLQGDVTLKGAWYRGMYSLPITGAAGITITGEGDISMNADNSGFLGDWLINGMVRLYDPDGLGAGSATINEGGTLQIDQPNWTVATNLVINGGAYNMSGGTDQAGAVTLQKDWTTNIIGDAWRGVTISGLVSESGAGGRKVTVQGAGDTHFTSTGNDWSGGTDVNAAGQLKVTAEGTIGTGPVSVYQGMLKTESAKGAVLTSVGSVEVERGHLQLNSTELDTTTMTLKPYGSLYVAGGDTPQDWQSNIVLQPGAVLDPTNIDTLPTTAEVGGQLLKGIHANIGAADTHDVGPSTDPDNLWSGVATATPMWSWSVGGTFNENDAGAGFEIFIHTSSRMITQNTLTLNTTGKVTLAGDGAVYLDYPWLGSAETIDVSMAAGRPVYIRNDGTIAAGKTVEVNSGYVELAHNTALAAGATVDVKAGGVLYLARDRALGSGSVTVRTGGAAIMGRDGTFGPAGNGMFTWEKNSQIALQGDQSITTAEWPTNGNPDFVLTYARGYSYPDIYLAEDTRLTNNADSQSSNANTTVHALGDYVLICAKGGTEIKPGNLDLAGKKLIAGATGTFTAVNSGTKALEAITQDGTLRFEGYTRTIGEIDIVAGDVAGWGWSAFGGADPIHISAGAQLTCWVGGGGFSTGLGEVRGKGTVMTNTSGNIGINGTDFAPGDTLGAKGTGVGVLHLNTSAATPCMWPIYVNAEKYPSVTVDVVTDGGQAGTDHDALDFADTTVGDPYNNDLRSLDVTVELPLPSGELSPNVLKGDPGQAIDPVAMTIISAGAGCDRSDTLHSLALGPNTHCKWVWDDPAADVTFNADSVVLTMASLRWTGFGGDSDLNGVVNYLDLGVLATYYDQTGLGWDDGDFNFDGKVDYMDLGILATNYDLTDPSPCSGSAPVPEPAFVILLGAGVVGLLRRRRQR